MTAQSPGIGVLTTENFPAFCRRLINLSFPMAVAEVLDLRSTINHSVDHRPEPEPTPDYREFRERLFVAMDSLDVNRPHHRRRLLRVMTMLRELHVQHSLKSRDDEVRLRVALAKTAKARIQSRSYGRFCLFLMGVSALIWVVMDQPGWPIKLVTAAAAWFALDYFRSLPTFDAEVQRLNAELNEVLRQRIAAVDWKTLIGKLSLILGLRQQNGLEVFRMDDEGESPGARLFH
jgi:hypothetical protein